LIVGEIVWVFCSSCDFRWNCCSLLWLSVDFCTSSEDYFEC